MFLRWPAISIDAAMPHLQIRRRQRRQKLAAFGMMCLNTHSAPVPPSLPRLVARLLHLRGTSVGGGRADDGTDGSWLTHEYVTSEVHQMRFERRRRRRRRFSSRRRRRLPYAQQKEGGRHGRAAHVVRPNDTFLHHPVRSWGIWRDANALTLIELRARPNDPPPLQSFDLSPSSSVLHRMSLSPVNLC